MAKLNMAKINTLIKKGYFLAGVVMAANMFVVNEVRAMEDNTGDIKDETQIDPSKKENSGLQGFIGFLLYWENAINLFGTLALSGANNYFKWWDYSPGTYGEFGCIGWRSKRLLNGIFQFDININLGRGGVWLIPGAYFYEKLKDVDEVYLNHLHVSNLIASRFKEIKLIMVFFLLQGFISMPLTLHISNFSISISLDSIIWGVIGMILDKEDGKNEDKGENEQEQF